MERLLRERPAGWFPDYDEMLLRALVDAVEEGRRHPGPRSPALAVRRVPQVTIDHPVIHRIPLVGKYFDIGPVPMSGAGITVKQTTRGLAPSMRMNADLGDWDRSLLNMPTGQSGQVLSSHYQDQWALTTRPELPDAVRQVEAKSRLEFAPASAR